MNYEEKYKMALERAKKIHKSTGFDYEKGMMEEVFPELKESEDERIRRAIHIYLDWLDGRAQDFAPKGEYSLRDMCAWLANQSKKLDANKVIMWLHAHIAIDEPTIDYAEDGQPLAESFFAHSKERCKVADEVVEQFKKDFDL